MMHHQATRRLHSSSYDRKLLVLVIEDNVLSTNAVRSVEVMILIPTAVAEMR